MDVREMSLVLTEPPRIFCRGGEPFPLPPRLKGAEPPPNRGQPASTKHRIASPATLEPKLSLGPAAITNIISSTAHLHPHNQTTPPERLRRRAPPPPNPPGITGANLGTEGKGWVEGITTVPSRRGATTAGLATAMVGDTNQGSLPIPTNTTATSHQQTGETSPALAHVGNGLEGRGEAAFRSEVRGPPEQPSNHAPSPPSIRRPSGRGR